MRARSGVTTRKRRKRIIAKAKGYFGSKHTLFKTAKEQVCRSERYSYFHRRKLKGYYRSNFWIKRINAACRDNGITYNLFFYLLKKANINLNRKMLSEIAVNNPKVFTDLINQIKKK